jgi:hypothetical protein
MIHKEEQDSKEEQEPKKNERTVLAEAIVETKPQVRESKSPKGKTTTISANFIPQSFEDDTRQNPTSNLELIRADFISYWQASGGKKIDWESTWRNNLAKVKDWPQYRIEQKRHKF